VAWNARRFDRFCTRHAITRAHLLLVALFLVGHPEQSLVRGLLDFAAGRGPAAIAAGRA
jgi:hypothetical protein